MENDIGGHAVALGDFAAPGAQRGLKQRHDDAVSIFFNPNRKHRAEEIPPQPGVGRLQMGNKLDGHGSLSAQLMVDTLGALARLTIDNDFLYRKIARQRFAVTAVPIVTVIGLTSCHVISLINKITCRIWVTANNNDRESTANAIKNLSRTACG